MDLPQTLREGSGFTPQDPEDRRSRDDYALLRDCNSSSRLTAQHFLWKDLLGYLVHPEIPTRVNDLKVADVATGNGIWLQDFASSSATSFELHGFDISLDQVGPVPWLPANIRIHTWDIFQEPPRQFLEYFDIVHVRLITVVVKDNDPRPVLENLRKLLKPGGYLQWEEVDTISCSVETVPGVTAENLNTLVNQLRGQDDWKYSLLDIMNESGYANSQIYTYEYGLQMARLWNDVYVSAWKEFAQSVLKTPEASRNLEWKGMEEARNGAAVMVPKLVWIAQRIQ